MIPVDREGSTRALRTMLKAADAARDSGRSIAIFPEGTRVPHGQCPPVRAGFAGLYRHLGLPVVPVALDAGRLWPKDGFIKHSGRSEEHTSELQSLMRISYAVFCLKKKKKIDTNTKNENKQIH